MSIRLNYQVDGYHIKAEVNLPEGRVRAADMLPVHREVSAALTGAVIARETGAGKSISCHKGCSACCKRLYVEISEAEAYRLGDTINALPAEHRQQIKSKFDAIRVQLLYAGLHDRMLDVHLPDDETRQLLSVDYYQQGIACPFLQDDTCSIYHERPLACREYLVTSPAEECERPRQGGVSRVRFPWSTFDNAMRMTQSAYDKVPLIPLPLLPSWLAQHPEPEKYPSGIELLMRSFSGLSFQLHTQPSTVEEKPKESTQPAPCRPAPSVDETSVGGEIVSDYAFPDALMVPHYGMAPIELLENIAAAAARSIGVILLTPDPVRTQAFIDRQAQPERFTMVKAASDTAWIRDRAPIAVHSGGDTMQWYLPRLPQDGRNADSSLFETICLHPTRPSPFTMARGNLVTGPDGLALSTNLLLDENIGGGMQEMKRHARQLGINRWIVFTPFTEETTRHADMHVRFLSAELAAIAVSLTSEQDQQLAEAIESQLQQTLPGLRILRIPMRNDGARYASPLNWIQLGSEVLVPRYDITQDVDIEQTQMLLSNEGFNPTFIDSPTLETGGSLHCLTASIYLKTVQM